MIKNNIQLKQTLTRLQEVKQQIDELRNQYSGIELEILTTPLWQEIEDLRDQIEEYEELRDSSLEQAIRGRLRASILLDNVSELLTKLRIAASLTQEELANKLGWQQSNLSRFESESYHSQSIAKVVEYASALDVWLHITPSLAKKLPEVRYETGERQKERSLPGAYGRSTAIRFHPEDDIDLVAITDALPVFGTFNIERTPEEKPFYGKYEPEIDRV
jgi:transcriptional regulator with XRE-family HTH domain